MDLRGLTFFTDYFVICSGINKRQLHAIADEIDKQANILDIKEIGMEGLSNARWVLIDYGSVVVHLFDRDARTFYDLELLWGDAPRVPWQGERLKLTKKLKQTR